jgi:NodT family efflux transporter outer membrane factor (OMF) lipoprotein
VARSKASQIMKPDVNVSLPPPLEALAGKELVQVGLVPYLNTYSMSTAAMWEPDIWGKNTRRYRSGKAMVDVAVADLHGALVSLSAEMANNYVLYRTFAKQRSRLQDNVGLLEEALKAAEARQGDLHDADVALARTLLADTRSKIPPLEAGQRQAENAMCVLLAIPPQDLKPMLGSSIRIPGAPKAVCAGVPADLLRRRPDVRRAESECAAQCEQIGVAKARIYPSFSLVGLVGYKSTLSSKLTDPNSWTGAISGGVDITGLLTYPVTKELQRMESERFQALVFGYQQAVLNAVREAENAATAFAKSQDQLGIVSGGAKSAKDASQASIRQYKDGKADFTYVLNSYQYLVSQQDQEAKVRGQVALNLVATYRALGGGWESDRPREVVTEQTKKDLKQNSEFRSFNGERRFDPICPTAPPPATR